MIYANDQWNVSSIISSKNSSSQTQTASKTVSVETNIDNVIAKKVNKFITKAAKKKIKTFDLDDNQLTFNFEEYEQNKNTSSNYEEALKLFFNIDSLSLKKKPTTKLIYTPNGDVPFPISEPSPYIITQDSVLTVQPIVCHHVVNDVTFTNPFKYLDDILYLTMNYYSLNSMQGSLTFPSSTLPYFSQFITYNEESKIIDFKDLNSLFFKYDIDPSTITSLTLSVDYDAMEQAPVVTLSMEKIYDNSSLPF